MFTCRVKCENRIYTLHNIAESKIYPNPHDSMLDWMLDRLSNKFGEGPFKVERIATYYYEIVPSDSPFGAYWPQAVVSAFLKDIGISEVKIREVMNHE